jgi:hypothetical protein
MVAVLFSAWVTAPVLDRVTVEIWRGIGVLVAVNIGVGGVVWTRSLPRNTFAIVIGLLGAGVWLDFVTPRDTGPCCDPTLVGVFDTVIFLGREVSLFLGSACAGGLPVWLWLRNRRL